MQKDNLITVLVSVLASVLVSVLLASSICHNSASLVKSDNVVAEQNGSSKDMAQAIEDYIMNNPEKIQEAMNLAAQKEREEAEKKIAELYKSNWNDLSMNKVSPYVGPKNAKITIVEFFDFNCGYCKRLAPDLMKVIKANPDVKFVFKPVTFLGSLPVAKAAMAANKQGKFLEMYEALLTYNGRVDNAYIEKTIKKIGLNLEKTKKLMESDEVSKELSEISALSQKINLRGVPTLIINGEPLRAIEQAEIQNIINSMK